MRHGQLHWPTLIRLTVISVIVVAIGFGGEATGQQGANDQAVECAEPDPPSNVPPKSLDEGPVAGPTDDAFAIVAQSVPAFAGMFLDESGNLNIYLLDSSQKDEAEAAIANVFGAERFEGSAVRVLQAQYGFLELYHWRLDMRPVVLGIPGVVSLDIDDTRNRVRVGLEEMEVQAAVEVELAKLCVPLEAVIFELDTPLVPTTGEP